MVNGLRKRGVTAPLFFSIRINATFWLGIGILVFGEVVYALDFMAMTEHPEKKKKVVNWGIYRVSKHSHVLAEKKVNREKFGKEYEDYAKRVPRYFLINC